jgi:hypothetical protein
MYQHFPYFLSFETWLDSWRQAIHEDGSAPSQCYLLSLLEIAHYDQCLGENIHLVQGVVMLPLVLLFCPEDVLLLPTPKGSLEDSA